MVQSRCFEEKSRMRRVARDGGGQAQVTGEPEKAPRNFVIKRF